MHKGGNFSKTSSQRVNSNASSEVKTCYENLYLTLLPSSGFFFISSPFSRPKNIRSYFRSAFLCSGSDMSKRISLITITAYVVHSFQHKLQDGYFTESESSIVFSSNCFPHLRQDFICNDLNTRIFYCLIKKE